MILKRLITDIAEANEMLSDGWELQKMIMRVNDVHPYKHYLFYLTKGICDVE